MPDKIHTETYNDFVAYNDEYSAINPTLYIRKTDIDYIRTLDVPETESHWITNHNTHTAYVKCFIMKKGEFVKTCVSPVHMLLKIPTLRDYIIQDESYISRAIEQNITWFLPEEIIDAFVF